MYKSPTLLIGEVGNNALSYHQRKALRVGEPFLTIPSLITGTIEDVTIGTDIVFEEVGEGKLISCTGLQHFVLIKDTDRQIVIFDNHNHALFFWLEWYRSGLITPGCELIHIDEHSDLWPNKHTLDLEKVLGETDSVWKFVNHACNVGNYITPAIQSGLIGNMIRIENEYQIDAYTQYSVPKNALLNIDLDIFAPELDYISEEKKVTCIQNLLKQAKLVTIATSPYFIEQGTAIEKLKKLLP